jgi:hypothetical protein
MNKTLSSSTTFFQKFILSGILISIACLLLYVLIWELLQKCEGLSWLAAVCELIAIGSGIACCYLVTLVTIPLKKVSVDARNLYISNYSREITVPLSDIEQVKELYEFKFKPILIYLKRPGVFGQKIKFMPHIKLKWWEEHPVVDELLQAAVQEQIRR